MSGPAPLVDEAATDAELLRDLDTLLKSNPLYGYNHPELSSRLHPKQLEFHASPDFIKLLLGGNRSGKTTSGLVDDLIQSIDDELVPPHLLPYKRWRAPFYMRLVINDLTKQLESTILPKIREWCPPEALRGGSVDRAWNDRLGMLYFANGSWWQIMSNEQGVDKFGSASLHRIHYDEEPRHDIFRESIARLIDVGGDQIFTMTPLLGLSWVFERFYEPWQERLPEADGVTVIVVDMDDNPHLSERGKQQALAQYTGEEREARKSGRFVHFSGLIYPQFKRDRHVIPAIDRLPDGVKVLNGIDPGIGHKAGILWAYLDSNDTLVVFDELVESDLTVEEIVKEMRPRETFWGVTPWPRIIDPAARNRSQVTGKSTQHEFERHKIYTEPGNNDWRPGVNAVRERLQREDPPGLLICANCVQTIAEFGKYRWRTPPRNPEATIKPGPVKRNDDALDSLRYLCMSRVVKPKPPQDPISAADAAMRKRLDRVDDGAKYPAGPGMFH